MVDDPEVKAMSAVAAALSDLDDGQQERVLKWAAARFDVKGAVPGERLGRGGGSGGEGSGGGNRTADDSEYEDFADLFNAAGPRTNPEKALVAGYWFQQIQGQAGFKGADAQAELKNLGHELPNVTNAMTSNLERKPAYVLQVSKSGKAQQARKTYKLTAEGVKTVQRMISGAVEE